MSGVCRQSLKNLQAGLQNSIIIGLIIDSSNMKTIASTVSRFNNGERGVWRFTLRDSKQDSINVTVWGSKEYVQKLSSKFRIGSVVEVINPKVIPRRIDDRGECFVPYVTSPFNLMANEGTSLIQKHDADDSSDYERLLNLPIKNISHLKSIKDILKDIENNVDQFVDMMVIVTFVSVVRDITTRDGRSMRSRSFEVIDDSSIDKVSLTLWDDDWIARAGHWKPNHTVVLINDAQITFDNYWKKTVIKISRRSLITENPTLPETNRLREANHVNPDSNLSNNPFAIPNPDTITTVMTIKEISDKINEHSIKGSKERSQFGAILTAKVTDINLDSIDTSLVLIRCAMCKKLVKDMKQSCMNLDCPCGNGTRVPINVPALNIKFNLKDDTGYLIGCRLNPDIAETAFGCTVVQFQNMDMVERSELKWKYILENCKMCMHIVGTSSEFPNPIYNILSIQVLRQSSGTFDQTKNDSIDDVLFPGDFL